MAAIKPKNISQQLAMASAALLGVNSQAVLAKETQTSQLYNNWDVDIGYLRYTEPGRITVDTVMAMINGNLSDKDTAKLGIVFDTLTGATPSGALPGSEIVSVSGVSGGSVSANGGAGGKVAFDDTRLAIDTTWGHEWQRLLRSNVSAYVSVEGDYTAIGGSLGIEKDTPDRTATYTAAIGMANDKVSRSDETTPAPLTEASAGIMYGTGHKNSFDTLLGYSRIINRRTIGMLNFTYGTSLGYHTEPYKVVSLADSNDIELAIVTERRPDSRERFIVYSQIKHEMPDSGHFVDMSYRLYTDSWDVTSHTFEGNYSFTLENNHVLAPFARLYHQQAAKFYTRTIEVPAGSTFNTVTLPNYASADIRLAEMLSATVGMKYQYKTSSKGSVDFRVAYIHRSYSDAVVSDDGDYFFVIDLGKAFD